MAAFPGVAEQVRADMFLHPHFRFFLREARATAYAQARHGACQRSACTRLLTCAALRCAVSGVLQERNT